MSIMTADDATPPSEALEEAYVDADTVAEVTLQQDENHRKVEHRLEVAQCAQLLDERHFGRVGRFGFAGERRESSVL